jgi:hypothetical protein
MTASFVLVVALVAFLAGATATAFLMLFIAIRKGDRPERILGSQNSRLDSCARSVLGSGTWPNVPVYRDDRESD